MSNHAVMPSALGGLGEAFSLLPSNTSISNGVSSSGNPEDHKNHEDSRLEAECALDETGTASLFSLTDVRIAVLGNVDAGKSTVVGVLTTGVLDNGRGEARKNVFLHPHEHLTGRTSTPSIEIMGFNSQMEQILPCNSTPRNNKNKGMDVVKKADYVLNLIDLCGHEKYLKTTLYGLTALAPHHSMIIIGSNMGLSTVTKDYISLVIALDLPFFIVVSKIDISPPDVNQATRKSIAKLLRNYNKLPYPIKSIENSIKVAEINGANRLVPIFPISSVTGEGLEALKKYLSIISNPFFKNAQAEDHKAGEDKMDNRYTSLIQNYISSINSSVPVMIPAKKKEKPFLGSKKNSAVVSNPASSLANEITTIFLTPPVMPVVLFPIDSIYEIKGLGFILSGTLVKGDVKLGDDLYLGPDKNNKFILISVKNIKNKGVNVDNLKCEQNGTILIKIMNTHLKNSIKRNFFRKGMILASGVGPTGSNPAAVTQIPNSLVSTNPNLTNYLPPYSSRDFIAVIFILHHSTTISKGYQPVIHCGVIRQSATLTEIIKLVNHDDEMKHEGEENVDSESGIDQIQSFANENSGSGSSLSLSTGSRAIVRFRFLYFNEVVIPSSSFIFREGKAKGVGKILRGL